MSAHITLCCHICCYQGNLAVRRRSAERCTAWRKKTCGAQPVAGKRPVRDSPTNPVHFLCPWDELFLISRRQPGWMGRGLLSQRSSWCCFLQLCRLSPLFPCFQKNNWWVKYIYTYIYIFKTKELKAGFETFSKTETFSLWQMRKKKHLNFQFPFICCFSSLRLETMFKDYR